MRAARARKSIPKSFKCINCGKNVKTTAPGTRNRNHCPFCLNSEHLDNNIGDRKSTCRGKMVPIGKYLKKDGEEVIVHRCEKCGYYRANRVAGDDSFSLVANLQVIDIDEIKAF